MSRTPPTSSPYHHHNHNDGHATVSSSHSIPRSTTSTPPPSGSHSPTASSSYLPTSLTSTVSSLLRRINSSPSTSTTPSTSLQSSQHLPVPGAIYAPPPQPPRQASPFQPPPLTPLSLSGHRPSTARLLTRSLAEEIRLLVPPRLQLQENWELAYSLDQDGVSLATLYKKCSLLAEDRRRGGWVLVVKDAGGGTFGAYLSDPPKPGPHYYGTGECFLWRASVLSSGDGVNPLLSSLPPPPSADTTNMGRSTTIASSAMLAAPRAESSAASSGRGTPTSSIRFKAFPYSGINDYLILCEPHFLSVGGGYVLSYIPTSIIP